MTSFTDFKVNIAVAVERLANSYNIKLVSLTWCTNYFSTTVAETSNQETKHHTQRIGELRFIMLAGPEKLTRQALSPKQRGYSFYTRTGMIKQVCGFSGAGQMQRAPLHLYPWECKPALGGE